MNLAPGATLGPYEILAKRTVAADSFRAGKPSVWAAATVRTANPRSGVFALHPDGQRVAVGTVASNPDQMDKVVLFLNFANYLKGLSKK